MLICVLRVRASGKRVLFEPRSVVTHYEGISSGTDLSSGTKRYQEINKPKFREKWAAVLAAEHSVPDAALVPRAARRLGLQSRTVLVVDSYVPLHDQEAGSNRLHHLVDGFMKNGYRVVFFPDNGMPTEPYTSALQREGVEVIYHDLNDSRNREELPFSAALSAADIAGLPPRPMLLLLAAHSSAIEHSDLVRHDRFASFALARPGGTRGKQRR